MAKYILYGNGIDDDYPAIQEMIDSGVCCVELPAPSKNYLISKTLKIHSGQTLKLSPYSVVKLAPYSNCAMLENSDFCNWSENICVDGGLWVMDNQNQEPNPWHFPGKDGKTTYERMKEKDISLKDYCGLIPFYTGFCMRFCRIKNFVMKNVTIKNPVTYCVQASWLENFTFKDINCECTVGAPKLWNMDGIHIEGNCKRGYINNIKGICQDDMVAITADDGAEYGPIEDIVVDGIFAEETHSAVRLLSHGELVKNIKITNVYGTYNSYCVGITKYHGGPDERGVMENIVIDNIAASYATETVDVKHVSDRPFIWVQGGLDIYNLQIKNVFRSETVYSSPTIGVDETAKINCMSIDNLHLINNINSPIENIVVKGEVINFNVTNVYEDKVKIK